MMGLYLPDRGRRGDESSTHRDTTHSKSHKSTAKGGAQGRLLLLMLATYVVNWKNTARVWRSM